MNSNTRAKKVFGLSLTPIEKVTWIKKAIDISLYDFSERKIEKYSSQLLTAYKTSCPKNFLDSKN